MSGKKLAAALTSIDWSGTVAAFCANAPGTRKFEAAVGRFAMWANQIEAAEPHAEAVRFVREARLHTNFVCALIALGLYKPAASSMRAFVECVLYYTYFRSHPVELATLARDNSYYLQKSEIMDFHRRHTANFGQRDAALGVTSKLTAWYSAISAIVHGQVPGQWLGSGNALGAGISPALESAALSKLEEAGQIVEGILFCTISNDLWSSFAVEVKRELLKGMSGATKTSLALSIA